MWMISCALLSPFGGPGAYNQPVGAIAIPESTEELVTEEREDQLWSDDRKNMTIDLTKNNQQPRMRLAC